MDGHGVPDGLRASCLGWREWVRRGNEEMAGKAGTLLYTSLSLDCTLPSPIPRYPNPTAASIATLSGREALGSASLGKWFCA